MSDNKLNELMHNSWSYRKNTSSAADATTINQAVSNYLAEHPVDMSGKVDKVNGKDLSSNDYTDAEKAEVAKIKDKVDSVTGKGLTSNDYTDADKAEVAKIANKIDTTTAMNALNAASGKAYDANNKVNDINVLGWAVPDACPIKNYVDAEGKFHQLVSRVDLGNYPWNNISYPNVFQAGFSGMKPTDGIAYVASSKYSYMNRSTMDSLENKEIAFINNAHLIVRDNSITSIPAMKAALSGVYLYFELTTPRVIELNGNESITRLFSNKVSKVAGKGLSTNDLTNELKASYDGAVEGVATVNGTIEDLSYGDVAGGKNLFDIEKYLDNTVVEYSKNGSEYSFSAKTSLYDRNKVIVLPEDIGVVTASGKIKATVANTNARLRFLYTDGTLATQSAYVNPSEYVEVNITSDASKIVKALFFDFSSPSINSTLYYKEVQLEKGTTVTEYEPYIPSVKMLSEENDTVNRNIDDLKMLGWTVPAECPIQNYTDSDGMFHQRVGRVDLGSLDNWRYVDVGNNDTFRIYYDYISNIRRYNSATEPNTIPNYYISNYETIAYLSDWKSGNVSFGSGNEIAIIDNSYSKNATAFKTAMQGVYLYYELATEITKKVDGNEIIVALSDQMNNIEFIDFLVADYNNVVDVTER